MARQVSLQDVLGAVGGPLEEKSLWALLFQALAALKRNIHDLDGSSDDPVLLVTPESMLLSHGGSVQILSGIPGRTSIFSPPEQHQTTEKVDLEKCYIYALGMSLVAAMRNELHEPELLQVSKTLQELFNSMIAEQSDLRPTFKDIAAACNNYFTSETEASHEIDALVSYVMGSDPEHDTYSEDVDIEEADLEAEIEQAMNLKRNNSVENLYPPSYGSRASSSLSLGSSGVCNRSLPSTRLYSESPTMYSSLPVVFRATSQDSHSGKQISQDRLVTNDLSNNRTNHLMSSKQTGQRRFYGPHFYTPSRRKKQNVSPLKNSNLQDGEMPASLFRSSSDGKAKQMPNDSRLLMNTHTLKLDDMPPLGPCRESTPTFDDSNSEASFSAGISESTPARQESLKCADNSSFEYSEMAIPTKDDDDGNEDFSFPSLPPVSPSVEDEASIEDTAELREFEESYVASEELGPVQETDLQSKSSLNDSKPSKNNHQDTSMQETNEAFLQQEKQNTISLVRESYSGSAIKLGKMFGPEFKTLKGLHAGEKRQIAVKIPADRRTVEVLLLNGRVVQFIVELPSTCRELFNQVVAHQSLVETHIFGLAVLTENGEMFMELDRKLLKYAPKGWISTGTLKRGKFTVIFRVKYYVENINQLAFSSTRHLYYLQLRKDILEGRTYCHEQSALKLAAYSLQAEMGEKIPKTEDLRVENYLPSKVISKLGRGTVQSILSDMHSELQELSQAEAEHQYLMEAQTLPEYGMVFYQVAKTKHEKIGSVWLGLSVRGIVIYDVHKDIKTPTSHWPWKKIKNLSYANKQFFMEVEDHRSLSYYAESYKRAQYLLHLSINYHRFQLLPLESSGHTTPPSSFPSPQHKEPDTEGALHKNLPLGETFTVEMVKADNIIGLRLAGGKNRPHGGGFIYVQSINKGSIADQQGKIQPNDILEEVNGESVRDLTHREAAAKIMSTDSVTLVLYRPYNREWLETISQ